MILFVSSQCNNSCSMFCSKGGSRNTIARGYTFKNDDLMRQWLIEQLMCHLTVNLERVRKQFNASTNFKSELDQLKPLFDDGWVTFEKDTITVHPRARQLSRVVAAAFDCYHKTGLSRHAQVS